jgi:hypothetical protein
MLVEQFLTDVWNASARSAGRSEVVSSTSMALMMPFGRAPAPERLAAQ